MIRRSGGPACFLETEVKAEASKSYGTTTFQSHLLILYVAEKRSFYRYTALVQKP